MFSQFGAGKSQSKRLTALQHFGLFEFANLALVLVAPVAEVAILGIYLLFQVHLQVNMLRCILQLQKRGL